MSLAGLYCHFYSTWLTDLVTMVTRVLASNVSRRFLDAHSPWSTMVDHDSSSWSTMVDHGQSPWTTMDSIHPNSRPGWFPQWNNQCHWWISSPNISITWCIFPPMCGFQKLEFSMLIPEFSLWQQCEIWDQHGKLHVLPRNAALISQSSVHIKQPTWWGIRC